MTGWRAASGVDAARRRADMLSRARRYFAANAVLSVDTPSLSRFANSDPHTENLEVISRTAGTLYLHTSPEFFMKRLLADGYPDIYTICRVYRDGELGRRHAPEFTMVEWYRLGFGLEDIAHDTIDFIRACLDAPDLASTSMDYSAAFEQFAGIDPVGASADELASCAGVGGRLRREIGHDKDAMLDLVMSTVVAPRFCSDRLTVVRHFPASQAALARLCPADPAVADRFEVFFGDLELANGYVELTDATEQRRRIDRELARREQLGRPTRPWDRNLVAALASGLPACAGVAAGLERLQLVHDKADDIRDVMTFAFDD